MVRSKILRIFGIVYMLVALLIFFGLRLKVKNSFSQEKLKNIISSPSSFRDKTEDACRYEILGEPKETKDYIKVEMDCKNGEKANSTLSLSAIEDRTINGVLIEYSRIVGFDKKILDEKFDCFIDGENVKKNDEDQKIESLITLKCKEK
ncbi:MAG: hypothetical protein PHX34_04990 [Candidatus Shapirobacteria bacterium]|nr:hypothetical protein [Candidatus Shapirobacteria bacterium]